MSYTEDQKESIRSGLISEIENHLHANGVASDVIEAHYNAESIAEVSPDIADMILDVLGYDFADNYMSVLRGMINSGIHAPNLFRRLLRLRADMKSSGYLNHNE